jgi:hypothetical protein
MDGPVKAGHGKQACSKPANFFTRSHAGNAILPAQYASSLAFGPHFVHKPP